MKIIVKTTKTFNQVSNQCERIITLHLKGYGTETMYQKEEAIYFFLLEKNDRY